MRAGAALLMLFSLAGVGACDAREVVVFSAHVGSAGVSGAAGLGGVPGAAGAGLAGSPSFGGSGGMSGGGALAAQSCQTTDECGPAWYCQKQSCADAAGVCLPNPSDDEDPVAALVCDCEGKITYWNDTLRKLKGVSASTIGACGAGAKLCMSDQDCGSDPEFRCFRKLRDFSGCANPGPGQCWVVPSSCPASDDRADFFPCPPPTPTGNPPPCLTLCQAINADSPFFRKRPADPCL